MSLDKLEGWAGRVGFRDIVYQFFGTFLSAIDLIAVSPEELTTVRETILSIINYVIG